MSSYHDVAGDVREFAGAKDANDLISGEPAEISESVTGMAKLGEAMTLAGESLARIETSGWTGQAADNFRSRIKGKPKQWLNAGTGLQEMSEALLQYRVVLVSSKDTASRALHMWKGAQAATKKAINEHNQRVETYNKAVDLGQNPGPQPVYQDPGKAGREQAEQMLEDARRRVTEAGYACGRVITEWIAQAPAEPNWWDRLTMNIVDVVSYTATGGADVAEGVWQGLKGINSMVRMFNPLDSYNLTHPAAMPENLGKLAGGLWKGVQNPEQFIKGALDVETWKDSPGRALGKLLPDVALGVATGGTGLVAGRGSAVARAVAKEVLDSASGGMLGLGQAGIGGIRKTGSMLGQNAAKLGQNATEDAARAGRNASDPTPSTTPQRTADQQSAVAIEQISNTLGVPGGNLRSRIDDLAAWSTSTHPATTTTPSIQTPSPPLVRQPPQIGRAQPATPARPSEPPVPMPSPVAPTPALRPAPELPDRPVTPPPPGSPKRYSYDVGQRVARSINDELKFSQDMSRGFPNGNGISQRLDTEPPRQPDPPALARQISTEPPKVDLPEAEGNSIAQRLDSDPPRQPEPLVPHRQPDPEIPARPENSTPDADIDPVPTAEQDLPKVHHVDPQIQIDVWNVAANPNLDLSGLPKDIVWWVPEVPTPLHRVESGKPLAYFFENGCQPWTDELANLDDYVHHNVHSGYVGASTDAELWMRHVVVDPDAIVVLKIEGRGGVDVEASRLDDFLIQMKDEKEIAMPGGYARERIVGGYLVKTDLETGDRYKVPGSWEDNPYFIPLD